MGKKALKKDKDKGEKFYKEYKACWKKAGCDKEYADMRVVYENETCYFAGHTHGKAEIKEAKNCLKDERCQWQGHNGEGRQCNIRWSYFYPVPKECPLNAYLENAWECGNILGKKMCSSKKRCSWESS